jgi:penicillin V acylase-like amidase (Ntn superfamily)
MKKFTLGMFVILFFVVLFFGGAPAIDACSTFVLQHGKHPVIGKNFDFHTDIGMVVINKRNVAKFALLAYPEKPARWVSKYGSITFNQVGREFPFGGMNEAGLIVEIMWLDETRYPAPDERAAIGELQWIQYQLDNCGSVREVIESDSAIRISRANTVHYLVSDRHGSAVTIEFIDGKLVYHTAETLPVKALTNSTYKESLEYLATHKGFGGQKKFSDSTDSLDRFARLARKLKDYGSKSVPGVSVIDYSFDILSSVAQGELTVWSIVYDLENYQIRFKTVRKGEIKIIRFRDFDFACETPVKVLDMNTDLRGDVTGRFVEYTTDMNRGMVFSVFDNYKSRGFMKGISDFALGILSAFPADLKCSPVEEQKQQP